MRARVEALCCDALVVTRLANVFYLTGFRGSAGAVVLTASDVHLATDGRYVAKASGAERLSALLARTIHEGPEWSALRASTPA